MGMKMYRREVKLTFPLTMFKILTGDRMSFMGLKERGPCTMFPETVEDLTNPFISWQGESDPLLLNYNLWPRLHYPYLGMVRSPGGPGIFGFMTFEGAKKFLFRHYKHGCILVSVTVPRGASMRFGAFSGQYSGVASEVIVGPTHEWR